MLKLYNVIYRGEFGVIVEAKTEEEAIEKAKKVEVGWALYTDLHEDFIAVEEA